MKKFFLIPLATVFALVVTGSLLLVAISTSAPAASKIAPVLVQKSVQVPQKEVAPDEQYTQLFCLKRQDIESVRTAYVVGGDILARKVAETLVASKKCEYRATVFNSRESVVPCDNQANGYCIAVQPVFTCKNDNDASCEQKDAIPGFDLEAPKSDEHPNTEAMAPVRTIIFSRPN